MHTFLSHQEFSGAVLSDTHYRTALVCVLAYWVEAL